MINRTNLRSTSALLFLFLMVFFGCSEDKPDDTIEKPLPKLEKLLQSNDLANSYEAATGYSADFLYGDVNYFGVYPMMAKGNTLYLGLGGSLPAGTDGAALAKYNENDASLTYLRSINEQGVMAFAEYGDGIAVPGADPCCGDLLNDDGDSGPYNSEWDWGNFYYIDTKDQTVVKHRTLPNMVHGWGSWYDEANNALYYAGSGHMADAENVDDATFTGLLFRTTDFGQTWTKVADRDDGIGLYRCYDVIGMENRLYLQFSDELSGNCGIAKSIDGGQTWARLPNAEVRCATRLYNVQNHLVALSPDAKSFIKIGASDTVSIHTFDAVFQISAYHNLSQDPQGNVYVGTTDGRVMHTIDFEKWTEIAHLDDNTIGFNTSTYWGEKQWLVLGNWGDRANLWKIPILNSDNTGLPDLLE